MVQASPQELRDFASRLQPADFSQAIGDLPVISLLGSMEETKRPNTFLAQWAPHMAGFGNDLRRGIEAFRSVATKAADSFESTDLSATDIMAREIGGVRANQPTEPGEPPKPEQPPAPPPKVEETPDVPNDVDILAPGPVFPSGGSREAVTD